MTYRGYELEEKTMKVGCQVIILKDGAYVRNSSVVKDMKDALAEAHAYIDNLLESTASQK